MDKIRAVTHASATVGTDSGTVLAANVNRRWVYFVNDSDVVMYLALSGTAATANAGIRLAASGGAFEMNGDNMFTGVVLGIRGAGDGNKLLLISEGS